MSGLHRVTMIDGRSGSGKTTLAAWTAARSGAQVLHVEDLYPGWDGLAAGSQAVAEVLEAGWYRCYDWLHGEFSRARIMLDRTRPLVIEGCGAITAGNLDAALRWAGSSAAVRGIWIECEEDVRKARALRRDGETFVPYWNRWAEQEEEHYALHEPWEFADETLKVPALLAR